LFVVAVVCGCFVFCCGWFAENFLESGCRPPLSSPLPPPAAPLKRLPPIVLH
jgi:hypothetical protein